MPSFVEAPKVGEVWQCANGDILKIIGLEEEDNKEYVVYTYPNGVKLKKPSADFLETFPIEGCVELGFKYWKVAEAPMANDISESKQSGDLKVKPGQFYKYFEGGLYRVKSVDMDSEDPSILRVSYENVKGESYSRPYSMFIDTVLLPCGPWDTHPLRVPRFKEVDEAAWNHALEAYRAVQTGEKNRKERIDSFVERLRRELTKAESFDVFDVFDVGESFDVTSPCRRIELTLNYTGGGDNGSSTKE